MTADAKLQNLHKIHYLHSSWEFWYYKRPVRGFDSSVSDQTPKNDNSNSGNSSHHELSYKDQLKPLGKISSLEEFQSYHFFMKKAQEMPRDIDLFFFRHGEIPMWE